MGLEMVYGIHSEAWEGLNPGSSGEASSSCFVFLPSILGYCINRRGKDWCHAVLVAPSAIQLCFAKRNVETMQMWVPRIAEQNYDGFL